MGDSVIADLIVIFAICFFVFCIVAAIWNPFSDVTEKKPVETARPLPKPPLALSGFSVDRADREFLYLEQLLADFRPSDFRGGGYETAIRPFKDHISEAISSHNAAVNKHNADVAKFVGDVTQIIIELERKC